MSHRLVVCAHPFVLSVVAVVIQARETGLAQPRRATLQAIVLDSYTECKDDDALHHSSFTRDVHAHTLLFRRKLGCRGQLRISRSVHRCAHRTMRTPHHAHTAPCATPMRLALLRRMLTAACVSRRRIREQKRLPNHVNRGGGAQTCACAPASPGVCLRRDLSYIVRGSAVFESRLPLVCAGRSPGRRRICSALGLER